MKGVLLMPKMMTIRQTAKTGILTHFAFKYISMLLVMPLILILMIGFAVNI